jgi:hypothetical protein
MVELFRPWKKSTYDTDIVEQRMGWDSSGEDSPSAWIHGVFAATHLAAWFYVCLEACAENRSETVFGGHSQHTSSTRDFPRR